MMPPAELGRLLSETQPKAGERALVIGSGTGYSAAVLQEIGLDVVALESDEALAKAAREAGIDTVSGELGKGWAKGGPYSLILLDGAVEEIPEAIARQLAPEGRIAGAGIDVYENEPKIQPALLKMNNVVLTPHLGSAVFELRESMAHIVVDNIRAIVEGRRPPNCINMEVFTPDG